MIRRWLLAVLFAASAVTMGGCSDASASVRVSANGHSFTRATGLPTPGGGYTACANFKIAVDRNAISGVFSIRDTGGGNDFSIETAADGTTLTMGFPDKSVTISPSLTVGRWNWVCATQSGSNFAAYVAETGVAGVTVTTTTDTTTFSTYGLWSLFREAGDATSFLNGSIQDAKIWSTALTQPQALDEMFHQRPQFADSTLNGFYAFLDAANPTIDLSGAGHNLTAVSTIVAETGPPVGWK